MSLFGKKQKPSAAAASAGDPQERTAPESAPEVIAAIAAVMAVMFDRPHRLVSVQPVGVEWSLEGRRLQLGSHRLR